MKDGLALTLCLLLVTLVNGQEAAVEPTDVDTDELHGCSFYQEFCTEVAECVDGETDDDWQCVCPEGMLGNGRTDDVGTGCRFPDCPSGMERQGEGWCLVLVEDPTDADDAQSKCGQSFGANLAAIHNADMLDYLQLYAANRQIEGRFWIGLNDMSLEGHYRYVDNSVVGSIAWAEGEPSAEGGKDCVFLTLGGDTSLLTTEACDAEADGYICATSTYPRKCPYGWIERGEKCYTISEEPATYLLAYIDCSIKGGFLVTVADQEEETTILANFLSSSEDAWIGLQRGYIENALEYSWDDKSVVDFESWNVITVPQDLTDAGCTHLNWEGDWTLADCAEERKFICEKSTQGEVTCPVGAVRFNGMCLKLKADPLDAEASLDNCRKMGGDLVSLTSAGKQDFVAYYLEKQEMDDEYWIGLQETQTMGNYEWTDESDFQYSNWAANHPTEVAAGSCTKIVADLSYTWQDEDDDCMLPLGSICEYKNTPCRENSDCHAQGECYLGQCRCKTGYKGDGATKCTDVDECLRRTSPCDAVGTCENAIGSFICVCPEGYFNDNNICRDLGGCVTDSDCHSNAVCGSNLKCKCKAGYTGDGKFTCNDVNECEDDEFPCGNFSICYNKPGAYDCVCELGYRDKGNGCETYPRHCDDVIAGYASMPKAGRYMVDPDGPGGMAAFEVECYFKKECGISIFNHNSEGWKYVNKIPEPEGYERDITYRINSVQQIAAMINVSTFCYQEMQYACNEADLLGTGYWVDRDGNEQRSWGGGKNGTCPCGTVGACINPGSACNCDGTGRDYRMDIGKVTDLTQLPITKLVLGGTTSSIKAKHRIGALYCGTCQFDVLKDCNELKKKKVPTATLR